MADTVEQRINCRIPHCLVSSLFDHKQVTLSFKRENPYKKQTLNDAILTDADLKEIVEITTVECYINHLSPSENLSDIEIENYKTTIGYVCSLHKELVAFRLEDAEKGANPEIIDRIETTRNAIRNNLNLLPSLETLQSYNLSCGRDVFLEILIMSIKNSSLAHQHDFFKIKNAKRKSLENKTKCLKKDFHNNTAEILKTEHDLGRIVDDEMREEVLRMRMFEQLNNEKITPYFLSLAKKPQQSENLLDVRKDNGEPFDNAVERDSYIKNYFAEIFKKTGTNDGEPNDRVQSINHFLGDVANHPEVIESKLSQDEHEILERYLNIIEFDTAIEKAKLNTSPGIDSISNRFIKTYWHIFRVPLIDYAKCCYDKGILTENFRCAKIRLTPKKGDTSLLKNWRPISLLNCFYKLISRVIALRLRSVVDKITRVGQKGFSGSRKIIYCKKAYVPPT